MSDWVHCNRCNIKLSQTVKFFISECGHVFCEKCVEQIRITKLCYVCKKPTGFMKISADMAPSVQEYFNPIENLLQKTIEVNKFQMQHRTMLLQVYVKKYCFAKKQYIHLMNSHKRLERENQMLKSMLRTAGLSPKPGVLPFGTSTPANSTMQSFKFTPVQRPGHNPQVAMGSGGSFSRNQQGTLANRSLAYSVQTPMMLNPRAYGPKNTPLSLRQLDIRGKPK